MSIAYVPSLDVKQAEKSLARRFREASPISGIRMLHSAVPKYSMLEMKVISFHPNGELFQLSFGHTTEEDYELVTNRTRFLLNNPVGLCSGSGDGLELEETEAGGEEGGSTRVRTLSNLLRSRLSDLPLIALVMNISRGIQITSGILRRASTSHIRDFIGYTRYPDPSYLDSEVHTVFLEQIKKSRAAYVVSSSYHPEPIKMDRGSRGEYVVVFSGVESCVNCKTSHMRASSFGIYPKLKRSGGAGYSSLQQVLQRARNLLVAGYAVYGSNTSLQIAFKGKTGRAHNLTLTASGEFIVCSIDYLMPRSSCYYSADEGRSMYHSQSLATFLRAAKNPPQGPEACSSTYTSCVLADIHQVYLRGGFYIQPALPQFPLLSMPSLVYHILPAAFVLSQAGGLALTSADGSLLDLSPSSLQQTSTFIIGSYLNLVDFLEGPHSAALD